MIEQRTNSDCVIACIAMATGKSYDEVVARLPAGVTGGLTYDVEAKVLSELGWNPIRLFGWRLMYPCILTVASLNYPGKLHSVWWDGDRIHDPSPKTKHTYESALDGHGSSVYDYRPEMEGIILLEQEEYHRVPK